MDRLTQFPTLWWFALRAAHLFYRAGEQRSDAIEAHIQLGKDIAANRLHRSYVDHYEGGAGEKEKWLDYKIKFSSSVPEEKKFRNRVVREEVLALRPKRFLNFGCLYGWLEEELARAGIEAHGIDRSQETRLLNEAEFGSGKFHAADIVEFLDTNPALASGAMLAHVNTGVYFLPLFLERLYGSAYRTGVQTVLAWEPCGRSRIDGKYQILNPDVDARPKVYRGPMVLHNYARLLKSAGFTKILRCEVIRPPHPHPDYRSAFVIASRPST